MSNVFSVILKTDCMIHCIYRYIYIMNDIYIFIYTVFGVHHLHETKSQLFQPKGTAVI